MKTCHLWWEGLGERIHYHKERRETHKPQEWKFAGGITIVGREYGRLTSTQTYSHYKNPVSGGGLDSYPGIISLFCWYQLFCSIHHNSLVMRWKMKHSYYTVYIQHYWVSSPREVIPLSSHNISASLSLLDSEWWNLRDSSVLESILSSKGQFASSKLSINRDT